MSAGCNHRLRKLRIGFRINEQERKKQVPIRFPAGKPSTAAGSQRNPAKIRSMRPLGGRRENCRPRPASVYFGTCGVIISTSEFSSSCAHDWSLSNPLKSPYDLRWEDDPGTLAHLRMRSGTFEPEQERPAAWRVPAVASLPEGVVARKRRCPIPSFCSMRRKKAADCVL